jgi:serine/threonine-protein kinase
VSPPASPATVTAAETIGTVAASPVVSIGVMSSAQALLARFIGPIARVLVRQSSLEVRSLDEFSDRLASHIDKDEERTRFKSDLAALIDHQGKAP